MSFTPEQAALRDEALQVKCLDYAAAQGWRLVRSGSEMIGPCPKCGGSDRFSINPAKNVWNCRQCGVGGDVIYLACHMDDLKFIPACERLTGRSVAEPVDPERAARLAEERQRQETQREIEAAQYREKARRDARDVWAKAHRIVGIEPAPSVAHYLQLRGLGGGAIDFTDPAWAIDLKLPVRFQPQRAYWHDGAVRHSGPAMIAAIQMPDGRFGGVHQTWIDLAQPNGKLALPPIDGKDLPAKKVLGVKKGGAIRLITPDGARRLVMGEGIETTLTAYVHAPQPDTAYWVGIDLGNMSGKAARSATGGQLHDMPDLDDIECFLAPDWVEELVYICDGDEAAKHTVEKVTRGLRRNRAWRERRRAENPALPPVATFMVPPGPEGTDLNSIAMAARAEVTSGAAD
jgi:hypothetical protein